MNHHHRYKIYAEDGCQPFGPFLKLDSKGHQTDHYITHRASQKGWLGLAEDTKKMKHKGEDGQWQGQEEEQLAVIAQAVNLCVVEILADT